MGDLSGLSPEQQSSLVMFSEVTANARDQNSAVEILQACNWNVEQALQLHWASGDDSPAPSASAGSSSGGPLLPGNHMNQRGPTDGLQVGGLGFFSKILQVVFRAFSVVLQIISTFIFGGGLPFGGGDEASGALLSNELKAKYGSQAPLPKFFEGSFVKAVQEARKEVKLLVVYLHSEHSRYTQNFCSNVIANDFIRGILDENFLLWGGDIARMEAHQISQMVHARQFPCFCVLLPASVEEIRVIGALNGDVSTEGTVALLTKCMEEMETHRAEIVARQEQHKEDRSLREDQDREYQEALELDRQQEEQKKVERARQQEAERLAADQRSVQEAIEAERLSERLKIQERRKTLASNLGPPGPDCTATVGVRLPAGQRLQRKFNPATTLADVYAWADCLAYLPEHEGRGLDVPARFMLKTSFPSKNLTEMQSNIQELQLSGALVLLAGIEDDD